MFALIVQGMELKRLPNIPLVLPFPPIVGKPANGLPAKPSSPEIITALPKPLTAASGKFLPSNAKALPTLFKLSPRGLRLVVDLLLVLTLSLYKSFSVVSFSFYFFRLFGSF